MKTTFVQSLSFSIEKYCHLNVSIGILQAKKDSQLAVYYFRSIDLENWNLAGKYNTFAGKKS